MKHCLCVPVILSLLACGGSSDDPNEKDPNDPGTVTQSAKDRLGADCVAACGAADPSLRCAMSLTDETACGGGWCMVDTKGVSSTSFVYCTYDCSEDACPAGFGCGVIDVIGHEGTEQACVADPPVCGDGVRQRDEPCERGETSAEGPCKEDCSGWACSGEGCAAGEPRCGDGIKQPPEVCDGDTVEGYCLECKELKAPFLELNNLSIDMISDTYDQWTHVSSQGQLTATLPTDGDASDCGRFTVVETTTELVRIEFTHCAAASASRATWTVAFPTKNSSWSHGDYDEALHPTAKMEKLDTPVGAYTFSETSVVREFDGNVMVVDNGLFGQYTIELIDWGTGEGRKAKLSFSFALLPPPAP